MVADGNTRCRDPHVRVHLGLRRPEPDRSRGRRRVPRCVGRRAIRHGHPVCSPTRRSSTTSCRTSRRCAAARAGPAPSSPRRSARRSAHRRSSPSTHGARSASDRCRRCRRAAHRRSASAQSSTSSTSGPRNLERPQLGVTTDGTVRTGSRSLGGPQVDTRPIEDAALAFLQALTPTNANAATFAMDADRVADVDQRPHEPLPPRRHVRGSGPAGARPGARHRARHALGTRVRPGPLDHAAQPTARRADGRLRGVRRMALLRVDLRSRPASASRGVGRSTATTCASTRWCSTAGS